MLKSARSTRVTDALPVLTPVRKPSDVADIDYSPRFLLPVRLDRSVVSGPSFADACAQGFAAYVENLVDDNFEVVDRFYSDDDVKLQVVDYVVTGYLDGCPLSWDAGLALGWLSALALVQPQQSEQGLQVFYSLLSSFITSPVLDQPVHYYVMRGSGFCYGRYVLVYKYCEDEAMRSWGFDYHRGRRTGELVIFSRYSDAVRLADSLNADLRRSAACGR